MLSENENRKRLFSCMETVETVKMVETVRSLKKSMKPDVHVFHKVQIVVWVTHPWYTFGISEAIRTHVKPT